jgi:hypothetical protein
MDNLVVTNIPFYRNDEHRPQESNAQLELLITESKELTKDLILEKSKETKDLFLEMKNELSEIRKQRKDELVIIIDYVDKKNREVETRGILKFNMYSINQCSIHCILHWFFYFVN